MPTRQPVTIAGVPVVTIPLTEYAELLACRRQLAELRVRRQHFERPLSGLGRRDVEVAAFIAERLGGKTMLQIQDEVRTTFGQARTPSTSSISRYWVRIRSRRRRPGPKPTRPIQAIPGESRISSAK